MTQPKAGEPVQLRDDLTLLVAPNPSPMTFWGTNTYILGEDRVAIVDPGPASKPHLAAILHGIAGRPVSHIFVTHSHLDHSPLARPLATETGAPIFAFGDSNSGKSAMMQQLASVGVIGGGEGVDHAFRPDALLADGDRITDDWGAVRALHTPGHMGNHLCFRWKDALFCGDHVMGWASSLVSPPDGDLTDFMRSCDRLCRDDAAIYYPAHGAPITAPQARLRWLIDHRLSREAQILAQLEQGPATPLQLAQTIYDTTPTQLLPAAARNVFAHLLDLTHRTVVAPKGAINADATFVLNADQKVSLDQV